jgi:competence protein ComEC
MDWRLLLAFAAGVILASLWPWTPGLFWPAMLVGLSVLACCWPPIRLVSVFALGAGWFLLHAGWVLDRQWPAERAGERVLVAGVVSGVPESRGQGVRFHLVPDSSSEIELPGRIQVSWYRPLDYLQPGQRWQMELRLDPPHGRLNVAGFDFHRYLISHRIGALATVVGQPERLERSQWRGLVDRQRQVLGEILQAEANRAEAAALMRALSIADRGGMTPALSEKLRQTGTAHLLAISGLHVGMVAGLAGLLGGWLLAPLVLVGRAVDRRRLAIVCALLAALAYAMLAGFTLPTQRALIMLSVAGVAMLWRRAVQPGHALLLALVAIVVVDPLAPLATGFWLSFSAVAVLIWAFAWRPGNQSGRFGWLGSLVRAQLVIAVGMLPLNIGIFQQWIPVALAANLVAIPMVGFWILPALLVSVLMIVFGLPAGWALGVTEAGLVLLIDTLGALHGLEFGHRMHVGGGLPAMVLAMVGALWLLTPPGWPARWLGVFLLLPLLWPQTEPVGPGELDIHMLDVGNGLAVVLDDGESLTLYDTGPGDGEGQDALGRTLPGLLAARGLSGPDRVVVSHAHRNHAGGAGTVRDHYGEALLYSSAEQFGAPCTTGMEWQSGGYRYRFLHPSAGLPYLNGNSSCVLKVSGPGGSVLLTGGIDATVEQRLLLENPELEVDVLVVPAGGHRRASSADFIDQVRPGWALVSVAAFDRSGRPHQEVVGRLASYQSVTTAECGAVTVRLVPESGPRTSSLAGKSPRLWRPRGHCP